MIISGIRCTDYERKTLVAMMQGNKNKENTEEFSSVLDNEMKKLESSQPTKAE